MNRYRLLAVQLAALSLVVVLIVQFNGEKSVGGVGLEFLLFSILAAITLLVMAYRESKDKDHWE